MGTISWEFNVRTDTQIIVSISIWNTRHKKLPHKRKQSTKCEKTNNLMAMFKRMFGCSWHFYRLNVRKTHMVNLLTLWRFRLLHHLLLLRIKIGNNNYIMIACVFDMIECECTRIVTHMNCIPMIWYTSRSLPRSFPFIRFSSPTPSFVEWRRDNERKLKPQRKYKPLEKAGGARARKSAFELFQFDNNDDDNENAG